MNYPAGSPDLMSSLADDGYSDFESDYDPTDEQITEWLSEDPNGALKAIDSYGTGLLRAAWCDTHHEDIEAEWDARGDAE